MTKFNIILSVCLIISCLVGIGILINVDDNYNDDVITELSYYIIGQRQKAYAEGQKDAINGDVRIKQIDDSTYIWTKSPWNNTTLCLGDTVSFAVDTTMFNKKQ